MSLMSTPAIKKANYIVQHFLKAEVKLISLIPEKDIEYLYHDNIDALMSDISKNNINLNNLLVKKNELIDKVQNLMELNSQSKKYLTEEQIDKFVEFTSRYNSEKEILQNNLELIFEGTYMNSVQQDVLNSSIDYDLIIAKLTNLTYNQDKAINILEELISLGEDTLNILSK